MVSRLTSLVAVAVVGGVLIAGCGSSSSSSSTPSTSSAAAASPTSSTSSSTAASTSTSGGSTNSPAAAAAKQGCEAGIKSNPALDPSKRGELSTECQKVADAAASGDKAKYKAAYLSFCTKLVGALPSAAQSAGKAACDQGANAIP